MLAPDVTLPKIMTEGRKYGVAVVVGSGLRLDTRDPGAKAFIGEGLKESTETVIWTGYRRVQATTLRRERMASAHRSSERARARSRASARCWATRTAPGVVPSRRAVSSAERPSRIRITMTSR
jgi:hypothetical protein